MKQRLGEDPGMKEIMWEIGSPSQLQDTVGFRHVDSHVTRVMITWIGDVMEHTCKQSLPGMSEDFHLEDFGQCYC